MRYSLDPVEARCPACHADRAERLYAVDAAAAAQHFVLRERDPSRYQALREHIETLWDGSTSDVLRCTACGFGFAHPYVAGDARFYDLAYERTGYPSDRWEFTRTLEAIDQANLSPGFSCLEVGAGDGAFLRRLTPARTSADRVLATEFSDYGRRAIEATGVRCFAADVRTLPGDLPEAPFEVVCLFQVLEHLDRIESLFEHLSSLASLTAHLFVAVPNDARVEFSEHHGGLLDLPPNHIGRWTPAAFDALAQRHGWRVAAHEIEPEGAVSQAKQFVIYRYMRRRQDARSLANRVEQIQRTPVRKALQGATAAAYGLAALPGMVSLVRAEGLGDSQWVHLRRSSE